MTTQQTHAVNAGMTTAYSLLDMPRLERVAETNATVYQTADPFPHAVLDNFLSPEIFDSLLRELPDYQNTENFLNYSANMSNGKTAQAGKYHLSDISRMSPMVRQLMLELNSAPFLKVVETLTGIKALLPDPQLQGGGIHMTGRGGLLRVHADFNKHPVYKYDRRVNLLLYCNSDWKEEYGGHLELWDKEMSECKKRVLPIANRVVMFSTTSDSFHGHPIPLTCPEGAARKSLALYYYTVGRPQHETNRGHQTLWQMTPDEQQSAHSQRETRGVNPLRRLLNRFKAA